MITLAAVNVMPAEAFETTFGDVAEHSPWVAREAARLRPFPTREAMVGAFARAVRAAPHDAQLALIRAHPDLATKARLTEDSSREQQGAGLSSLLPEEFKHFTKFNDAYKSRFGFPFIFAVKGADKQQILASFAERVNNSPDIEFDTAIAQIANILRFRIEDRVSP
jgi:2-oxo-4-hydroxy-4-carboxy-5-ureidoimidazoline decarboxylase